MQQFAPTTALDWTGKLKHWIWNQSLISFFNISAGSFPTQLWRGWEAKGRFTVRLTPWNSQLSNLDSSWPSCPSNALPAADGRSSAWHGTGLAGDRSQAFAAEQTSPALPCLSPKHFLGVILSKPLYQGAPRLGCSFLQPGMEWQAWRAAVVGLRKGSISTEDQ